MSLGSENATKFTLKMTRKGNPNPAIECQSSDHETEDQDENILVLTISSSVLQVGKNSCVVVYDDGKRHDKVVVRCSEAELCPIDYMAAHGRQKGIEPLSEGTSTEDEGESIRRRKKKIFPKRLETAVHKSLPPAAPSHSYEELYKMSDDVMIQVQILRDNGRWDLFEDTAVTLSRKYPSLEAQIVILLERGMAACYSNRFQDAKRMMKSAIEMASNTENSSVLVGRGHYYLSAVYRRAKKTGKAITCVEIADQNLCNHNIITDSCSLTYERASALMDFILQCAQPKPVLVERVMADLRRSIDECLVLSEDGSQQRYVKTHHYALMKMAMLRLDCRTSAGRKRTVDEKSIQEAEKYLAILKERYWDKTSHGEKVQYFFAQADLHFRKKQLPKAREFVLEALEMAESYGFNTEIELAKARLEDIENLQDMSRKTYQSRDDDVITTESSSGKGDVSSSSDSDWLSKPSLL